MSPVLAPPVEAPPVPPERPRFVAVAWATFLGYLLTVLVGFPVLMGAVLAGLPLLDPRGSVERGLFYRYDVWSWGAEACVGLLAIGFTSVMVGHQLRTRTRWEVPFGFIFLTLLVTGYAPLVAITPLYGATGFVSLLLAAWLLRRRARPSGAEPTTPLGQVPRRYRRTVAIALALGVPLAAIYALGYATTHPLRFDTQRYGLKRSYERDPGAVVRYMFRLDNGGRAPVTDLAVTKAEGSPALQLERAGALDIGSPIRERLPLRPLAGVKLERDDFDDGIALQLRQGPSCSTEVAALDAIWVRYTVLGMRHEQRIPLVDGPSVRCR
jgi:hypothetical protein